MAKTLSVSTGQASGLINNVLQNIQAMLCDCCHTTATLAIATTTTKVKTTSVCRLLIDGALVTKAATDNAFTLAGTVVNATFNVFVMTLKADGTCTPRMGTAGATRPAVVFPQIPKDEVVIGYVEINPTGTGNFVGGTTALTDGTVVPNAVYVNTPFPFNPNILTLPHTVL